MSVKSEDRSKNAGFILNRLKHLKNHQPYEGYSVKYIPAHGGDVFPMVLYKGAPVDLGDEDKGHPTANKFHQAHAQHYNERQEYRELLNQALRGRRERLISEALREFRKSCER